MYHAVFQVESRLLADYFRYLFPPDKEGGDCVVSVSHPVGALMVAFALSSIDPILVDGAENLIPVDIPRFDNATSSLQNHYVYFSKEAEARIGLALRASFELDFAGYYRRGEELGLQKKDIVEAYVFSRRLIPDDFSTLHKRVYRRQQKALEGIRTRLLRKAYYLDEAIDYSGLFTDKD